VIDFTKRKEDWLSPSDVAARLPRRRSGARYQGPTKPATVRLWMRDPEVGGGLFGVQLQSVQIGGCYFTTWEWVTKFFERVKARREEVRQKRLADLAADKGADRQRSRAREKLEKMGAR
jgi:hypothetical protein